MSRRPRYECAGASQYVVTRSSHGLDLFRCDEDYSSYLSILASLSVEAGIVILAYALLPREAHLLLQPGEAPAMSLSMLMKRISQRFSRYWSLRYGTGGHLFASRFVSILVDGEQYLGTLIAHVHRLPVAAGLASESGGWPWTSHGSYERPSGPVPVDTERLRDWQALSPGKRGIRYEDIFSGSAEMFTEYMAEAYRTGLLGDETFRKRVMQGLDEGSRVPRRKPAVTFNDLIGVVMAVHGVSEEDLIGRGRIDRVSIPREVLAYLAVEELGKPVGHVARYLRRDQSLVSRIIRKLKRRPSWRDEVERVREALGSGRS